MPLGILWQQGGNSVDPWGDEYVPDYYSVQMNAAKRLKSGSPVIIVTIAAEYSWAPATIKN